MLDMLPGLWKTLSRQVLCGAALFSATALAHGQSGLDIPRPSSLEAPRSQPVAPTGTKTDASADELRARVERLERQNQELIDLLKNGQAKPQSAPVTSTPPPGALLDKNDVQKMIAEYLTEREAVTQAKEKAAADKGFVVGKNLGLTGMWLNHQPWFETQDKAFRFHVGGRFHGDWVFGAGAADAVISGKGGTGAFQESFNWRRARLQADGWIGEVIDFFVEFEFVQQFSTGAPFTPTAFGVPATASGATEANTINPALPTDVWAGINHIPYIGGLRIGSLKFPLGLDHLTSSRYLDFLERSAGFDTYYNRANGWEPGFMIHNETENQRMTWQVAATRHMNGLFGYTIGGGEWRYTGRITALPWYEDNGRRMMHVGVGGCFIDSLDQGNANLVGRWLLRNGGNALQNVVGLARVFGDSQSIINPELFINLGPWSIQSEYVGSQVNGVTSFITQLTGPTAAKIPARSFYSHAAYVQLMYFLTGESRPYNKSTVHSSGAAPTRVVPFRNYFWVPGQGGNGNPFSAGAWQVGARYSFNDLNDGPIIGGISHEVTLGLNWFLNPNMKIQWNYDIGQRYLAGGTSDGRYYGFGMRMAFDF
ncbi:MAG: hypothetical protein FJ303_23435 [Planctomycetes bacterium]|nr:hypothetical protein [Planctomycetota bacterium]